MRTQTGAITMIQGRILGGTSAVNGLATLRGQPDDYDGWAEAGLPGWGWNDVKSPPTGTRRDLSSHPYSDVTPKPGLNFLSARTGSRVSRRAPKRGR